MSNRGQLIVLSGPSGCGKGTILKEMLRSEEKMRLSISLTTRSPRPGEVDGIDYFYVSKEQFEKMVEDGAVLEHAEYCDNYYGTPRSNVENWRAEGYHVILEIEPQGAFQIKKNCPDATMIFILPPSLEELEHRLTNRGTEDKATVQKRLAAAVAEIRQSPKYDYIVVNDVLETAVEDVRTIIHAQKNSSASMQRTVSEILGESKG
ncbi:MAG TPA: guanylate kinase [Firmicutes bacterium]|nr:guanylate kinase [Bacillota bacterium]